MIAAQRQLSLRQQRIAELEAKERAERFAAMRGRQSNKARWSDADERAHLESLDALLAECCPNAYAMTMQDRVDRAKPMRGDSMDVEIKNRLRAQPSEFRDVLALLYNAWVAHAAVYFDNRLTLPTISVADLSAKGAMADCGTTRSKPFRTSIRFCKQTLRERSTDDLVDVLLHEQIHAAIHELTTPTAEDDLHGGHGFSFAEACNKIAKARGWRPCVVSANAHQTSARVWPPRLWDKKVPAPLPPHIAARVKRLGL